MARARPARLVNPMNAILQEELRHHGVPSGRDRSLEAARQKRADTAALKPRVVEGNIKDSTAPKALLQRLQDLGIIIDETVEGGSYGDELHHPVLINANSPRMRFEAAAGASPSSSTTNTATTVNSLTQTFSLPVGKWDVICLGAVSLTHNTGGSSAVALEIDGTEDTADAINGIPTTGGLRCETAFNLDDVVGDRDITIRMRFRSNSSVTTDAKNPRIITLAWRTDDA